MPARRLSADFPFARVSISPRSCCGRGSGRCPDAGRPGPELDPAAARRRDRAVRRRQPVRGLRAGATSRSSPTSSSSSPPRVLLPPWAIAVLAVVCFVPGWVVAPLPLVHGRVQRRQLHARRAWPPTRSSASAGALGGATLGPRRAPLALAGAALAFVVVNHAADRRRGHASPAAAPLRAVRRRHARRACRWTSRWR